MTKGYIKHTIVVPLGLLTTVLLSGLVLSSSIVSATNDSVVDQVNITVPVSCTMTGTGMDSHSTEIENGLYENNIGTTTLHAFCNDNEGFAIYAAGYTGNEIGGTNSNKLVGTNASSNATIVSGIATTAGNPDISNWAMKLAISQDSGDTTSTNALTIDSAPNVDLPSEAEQGATPASFSEYHVVPNEYVKVAHKNSMTDMTASTGGVKLTTTYAAYISKTQPADTYTGQVIYTLVHPSNAPEPVPEGKVGVTYHANGSTFTGGAETNRVIYTETPMYIAATPQISKTSNVSNDGTQNGSYSTGVTLTPVTATGASKMKVAIRYGLSTGTTVGAVEGSWNGQGTPERYERLDGPTIGTTTYVFNGDTVTFAIQATSTPSSVDGQDYGYFAEIYPIYDTEQTGTELTEDFTTIAVDRGTYTQTTNWYGSWYADINNQHYEFANQSEVEAFLYDNLAAFDGINIDLYRSLTFAEAYTRANKTQDGGYYIQQELTKSMCNTVAVAQNQTVKDIRDGNTYMIGKLKDGNCWMLDNLALDPTDPTTAANMNENNTNATQAAITNLLNGGSSTTGWSSVAVENKDYGWNSTAPNNAYEYPYVHSSDKDTLFTSYGPAAVNGQAKAGVYYNLCAASVGTYCYNSNSGLDVPDTLIDVSQDVCPSNWRMPTGGSGSAVLLSDYSKLISEYGSDGDATNSDSLQYNLSTPVSGEFYDHQIINTADYLGLYYGRWWSSTTILSHNYWYARTFYAGPISAGDGQSSTDRGNSVRCLVGE